MENVSGVKKARLSITLWDGTIRGGTAVNEQKDRGTLATINAAWRRSRLGSYPRPA
jgi:hypothetical protein